MVMPGRAMLMRLYTDERAKADGTPLYTEVVERARRFSIAGATVLRAVVGFGESKSVQRASILDLSGNLPLVIELVDDETKLRAFWEELEDLEDVGLVTFESVEVLHYGGKNKLGGNTNRPGVEVYRVSHRKTDESYYLMAGSKSEAISIVTRHLADLEGRDAWSAEANSPDFPIEHGKIFDGSGQVVPPLDF